jgi:hypothetical protein
LGTWKTLHYSDAKSLATSRFGRTGSQTVFICYINTRLPSCGPCPVGTRISPDLCGRGPVSPFLYRLFFHAYAYFAACLKTYIFHS